MKYSIDLQRSEDPHHFNRCDWRGEVSLAAFTSLFFAISLKRELDVTY